MPHECTNCGRTFADGSKEMLSGCPDCGGKKFQFRPAGNEGSADPDPGDAGESDDGYPVDPDLPDADPSDAPPEDAPSPPAEGTATRPAETGSRPSDTDPSPSPDSPRDPDATDPSDATDVAPTSETVDATPGSDADAADAATPSASESDAGEDTAQASARSDVVSPDEIRNASGAGSAPAGTGEDEPDIETLREELNEQFESIRILNPGQYELNLMELYDRDEYIISLREDGRYVIEMPEGWGPHDDG